MTDIFGSYNFGYTDYDFMMPKTCSIEDITDEDEFEDELEEDINADDLSKAFDNVIEDWKIKMEVRFSVFFLLIFYQNLYNLLGDYWRWIEEIEKSSQRKKIDDEIFAWRSKSPSCKTIHCQGLEN